MLASKTFFITGVSSGLGRALAEAALAAGHRVIGTLRQPAALNDFHALAPGRAHGVLLDMSQIDAVAPVIDTIEREVAPIDVLVNNAGYGHEGVLEELALEDIRRQFEVNLFGAFAAIHAVLPHMRRRRAGRILNITSMGGIITNPGLSIYHASKFALEGLSESLGKEVKALGIHVTAVAPGGFRTQWAGPSLVRVARRIADYDAVFDPIRKTRRDMHGHQLGDPTKAARAMLDLIEHPEPPAHLLLGSDAIRLVRAKLDALTGELDAWQSVSASTDATPE